MNINYYEILDVSSDAETSDIKKAYVQKLRQYPNEKFPEEFKLIRRAYEILSNEKSRKEHDTMTIYGEEINNYQNTANVAMESNDYVTAINNLKQILLIEPSLLNIRNQLGLAYIYNGDYEKAVIQFKKLVETEKDNATYQYNLGFAYHQKGDFYKAIDEYYKAFQLDPNDPNIVFSLSNTYVDLQEYNQARKVLIDVLSSKGNEGFRQFMYLFKLLQVNIFAKDSDGIKNTLEKIEDLVTVHPEEKQYVAHEFGKFAYELFRYKQYQWAIYLTEKGVELDPNNEVLRTLHDNTANNKIVYGEFDQVDKDELILDPLKNYLYLYLFGDEYEEDKYKEHMDNLISYLEDYALYQPDTLIKSLKRLDIKYFNLFKEKHDFFTNLLAYATENQEMNTQYERMKEDNSIVNSVKRLIALYLSNVSEEERSEYFNNILDEMSYEPASQVVQSVNRLENVYPRLFKLNPEFLNEVKKNLSNSNSNQTYSSNQTTYSGNTHNSSSNSCFVATAAFGSPLAKELDLLRYWRDYYLKQSFIGKQFINFYYKVGPSLASVVECSPLLKRIVRKVVYKIISIIDKKHDLIKNFNQARKGD